MGNLEERNHKLESAIYILWFYMNKDLKCQVEERSKELYDFCESIIVEKNYWYMKNKEEGEKKYKCNSCSSSNIVFVGESYCLRRDLLQDTYCRDCFGFSSVKIAEFPEWRSFPKKEG